MWWCLLLRDHMRPSKTNCNLRVFRRATQMGSTKEDALEDSTITQHCCQEFLVTLSRRSSQHHVGCKLLAAQNPHSVRYRTARTTRPWTPSSKTRCATEGCMRPRHLMSAQLFVKAQNQVRMRTDRLAAMTFSTGHSKKGHGINCAQRVTRGHVMGMHLHHLVFPGPWGMQSESST